jgi:SAM-dependent MidA family methyltransferase
MPLPEPSADALLASRALESLIKNEIRAHHDWISFARFMDLALYAEGLGYYAGGSSKLGKDGDFTTAPEITPLFGATIGRFALDCFGAEPLRILEFGAGTGRLALDVMESLAERGVLVEEYLIVELSADLRERQRELLGGFPQVQWLSVPPTAFSGLILCNEVLDAMPVHLLVRQQDRWFERGVSLSGERFVFSDRETDAALAAQIPEAHGLPEGYLTEVHPRQCGFVRMLSDVLKSGGHGLALLIDYGFPAREYFLPQRQQGTVMCHYRHHAHTDPFYLPGLQDLTAHVDFTAVALAAQESGLSVAAYMSQAEFLIAAGLTQLMGQISPEDARRWLTQSQAIQKLTSPAEMGELFKVLLLSQGVDLPRQLLKFDRSYRL